MLQHDPVDVEGGTNLLDPDLVVTQVSVDPLVLGALTLPGQLPELPPRVVLAFAQAGAAEPTRQRLGARSAPRADR